ncbi:isocitrate lyase/phosphoenolpyruvate mutase family protein [Nonomuraea sp. B5E05]|uniref:isocitrate lyase/PEP mutase family protein n=1 Tax=Nonomuraea sp. B5E05 TaxID=3153569 RepID=UPI003261AC98
MTLNDQAALLRELHKPGSPLLLPNVWDAASARVVAEAGFPALATASAAISAMLGYPDGEGAAAEEMFAAAGRVIRVAQVPVTVDAEAGYGLSAGELVGRLIGIGAAGFNLEDSDPGSGGLVEMEEQARRIADVRAAATGCGVDIVINARVDVFRGGRTETADVIGEAVERGTRYLEAGADCVYPIMARSEYAISALVSELPGPVNTNCLPGGPSLDRLTEIGVARVSFGSGPHKMALGALKAMSGRIRAHEDPFVA